MFSFVYDARSGREYSGGMFNSAGIIVLLLYVVAIVAVIILVVVLVRFLIAATRARDAETAERKLRIDLLIAERGRDLDL